MELFIPSVLLLLFTAAVVFFVLPRFGAPVLAVISVALLVFGIYHHVKSFGTEWRLSTWHLGYTAYAPFIMVGAVILVIGFYVVNLMTSGATTALSLPEIPSVANMPKANTATNVVTEGVNNALKGITNVTKGNNQAVAAANTAITNVANQAATGVANAVTGITNVFTGNTKPNNKGSNNGLLGGILGGNTGANKGGNKGSRVPGLNFPLSQV
jgi:hypothetical protein